MRSFRTADDHVLVEWALSETAVIKPDRTPLGHGGTFYLLDPAGAVVRTWATTATAVQEHLSTSAYVIEGEALVCYFHDAAWLHEDRPSLSRSVELEGLRPLSPEAAPSEDAVREAIEHDETARAEAWAEHERAEQDRLARFERALPPLRADEGGITLRWRYDGPDIVIERATGEELWRETDWPGIGKTLFRRLRRVAEATYGERLDGFEVDVPADEFLRFDND